MKTAAAFLLLAAMMGALQWNWFAMPLERDEGEYAYSAWLLRTGKGVPYKDSFLQKPPMIVYTYGLVEALAPKSDKVGFRVAGFLAALATAGLVWHLGEREFGRGAGAWGAWLWVIFVQQATMFYSAAANVEKFMVVPMLGAMALTGREERRGWQWGLAGMLAGIAVLYKPICLPPLAVHFLLTGWGQAKSNWRRTAACWGWAVLGGVMALTAGVAWFAMKGALGAMWECTVEFTRAYAELIGHPLRASLAWVTGRWKAWPMLGFAALGFCFHGRTGGRWGAVSAAALWVAMTNVNGHYFVMTLPLAAIGAGAGIECLVPQFRRGSGWMGAAIIAAVFALLLMGREGKGLRCSPRQLAAALYRGNPFCEAEKAGKLVQSLCGEDETVHIVGSEPEILWLARRKGSTRFDIAYPMTLPTRYSEKYQGEALDVLKKELPAVVVFARTDLGLLGSEVVYGGYFHAMGNLLQQGGYHLKWAHVEGGGWMCGGNWNEWQEEGASLGIWAKEKPWEGACGERSSPLGGEWSNVANSEGDGQ